MRFRGLISLTAFVMVGLLSLTADAAAKRKRDEPWDIFNDPLLWMKDPVLNLADLPRSGAVKNELYSAHSWSQYRGGFAWRPNTANNMPRLEDIDYPVMDKSGDKEKILKMSQTELAKLSPAEKLSLINCDFTFTLVKEERARYSKNVDQARSVIQQKQKTNQKISLKEVPDGWFGHCNHAAELPLYFEEPTDSVIPACEGLQIPASSADLKALGMMALRKTYEQRKHDFIGLDCNNQSTTNDGFCATCAQKMVENSSADEETKKFLKAKIQKYLWTNKKQEKDYLSTHSCKDLNPGSFFVLLANRVGKQGKAIIMDRDGDATVWNRPIKNYQAEEIKSLGRRKPQPGAAEGTSYEIPMRTTIEFVSSVDSNQRTADRKQPVTTEKVTLDFYLEVRDTNGQQEILGGSWITKNHPDTFWKPADKDLSGDALLMGEYSKLKGFLKAQPSN